jgi:hypothetical protein
MRPCNELLAQYLEQLELRAEYLRERKSTPPLQLALNASSALLMTKVLPSGRAVMRIRVN